jgi:hypothetical protein
MTRLRWRIAAVASALVFATTAIAVGGPVATLAAGPGQMVSTSYGWKDPACGTANATYQLRLFRDVDYQGTQWRFCSGAWTNLCWVPHGADSSAALLCSTGYDGSTANDYPSSAKLTALANAGDCRVEVHEHANHQGGRVAWWSLVNVPDLSPWPDDAISSVRRVC